MKKYSVENTKSGHVFGIYEAKCEGQMLEESGTGYTMDTVDHRMLTITFKECVYSAKEYKGKLYIKTFTNKTQAKNDAKKMNAQEGASLWFVYKNPLQRPFYTMKFVNPKPAEIIGGDYS